MPPKLRPEAATVECAPYHNITAPCSRALPVNQSADSVLCSGPSFESRQPISLYRDCDRSPTAYSFKHGTALVASIYNQGAPHEDQHLNMLPGHGVSFFFCFFFGLAHVSCIGRVFAQGGRPLPPVSMAAFRLCPTMGRLDILHLQDSIRCPAHCSKRGYSISPPRAITLPSAC